MVSTLLEFLTAWGTSCGDAGFIAAFDVNNNCLIDTTDLLDVLSQIGNDTVVAMKKPFMAK
mgnify:CR=1